LLKCFITKELMRWPGIESLYGPTLRQSPVFAPGSTLGKKTGAKAEEKKPEELANPGEARWEELHKRVIEHVSVCDGVRITRSLPTLLTLSTLPTVQIFFGRDTLSSHCTIIGWVSLVRDC
jgi:26S proteasome regulatory subunit N5